jgi:DNA-binding CsgD family transcriptional regulator
MLFLPEGTPEQMAWYDELLRTTTSVESAIRLFQARGGVDVVAIAPQVKARTLVIHARDDRVVPLDEGILLASLIPDARLVMLDSANHILLSDEPAWEQFIATFRGFLGSKGSPASITTGTVGDLSPREREVLELVAAGLANETIAERLCLSVRTVERHLSNVYTKLGLSGKAARAAAAVSLIRLPPPPGEHLR